MKILNFCYDDYANYMYHNTMALRSVGVQCDCIKIKKHPFGYENEADIVTNNEALQKIQKADIIQFFHSNVEWYKIIHGLREGKRIIVYHTGTLYRREPERMNEIFKDADLTVTDQCEFMHIGYNGNKWKYAAVAIDTDKIHPVIGRAIFLPYVVAHYPSNSGNKGSAKVLELINKLPYHNNRMRFMFTDLHVTHPEQMKRLKSCDIYIEMFSPTQNGKPYGCYGVTAFEAAAMGKIVITQNIYPNVYKEAYGGEHPFIICNTESEFTGKLHELIMKPKEEIDLMQQDVRRWMVNNHSYQATGKYLKKLICSD